MKKLITLILLLSSLMMMPAINAEEPTEVEQVTTVVDMDSDDVEVTILSDIELAKMISEGTGRSIKEELEAIQSRRADGLRRLAISQSKAATTRSIIQPTLVTGAVLTKTFNVTVDKAGTVTGKYIQHVVVDYYDYGDYRELIAYHGSGVNSGSGSFTWENGSTSVHSSGVTWVRVISVGMSEYTTYRSFSVGVELFFTYAGTVGDHYIYRKFYTWDTTFNI